MHVGIAPSRSLSTVAANKPFSHCGRAATVKERDVVRIFATSRSCERFGSESVRPSLVSFE